MTVAVVDRRHAKPFKYSYDARKVLQTVWATSGGLCGKYLAVSMEGWLDAMEAEGSLVLGVGRYNAEVRGELLAMSAATIDRYLAPVRDTATLRGIAATTGLSDGLCKWWSPDLKGIDCDHDQQEEPGAGVGSPPVAA